jgi:pimeloyl-ACP methyl ester carboxylesterase
VNAKGVDIHLVDWGDAAGQPVVLLHGLTENAHTYDWVCEWLAGAGYRPIAIDFRDHGQSGSTTDPATIEDLRDEIVTVVRALGLASFGLIGHSMGGRVAMAFASTYPELVRWLVVEDAPPGLTPLGARLVEQYLASIPSAFPDMRSFVRFLRGPIPGGAPEFLRHRALTSRRPLAGGGYALLFTMPISQALSSDLWEYLAEIQAPTLVLRGRGSKVLDAGDAARMAEVIPQAELVTVERAGHVIHGDNPAGYMEAVGRFLGVTPPA